MEEQWEAVQRLNKDLKLSAKNLGRHHARFLVDRYYQIQNRRIRDAGQIRSSEGDEPNQLLEWMYDSDRFLEGDIKIALDVFTKEYTVGLWLQSICGIGPVISAGLLAHLEMEPWKCEKDKLPKCKPSEPCVGLMCRKIKIETAGHFWSFAGLEASIEWKKGEKRPWNAELKTLLAFKAGESFVKVQNNEKDFYGKLYVQRKALEMERNLAFAFKDQAAAKLEKFNIGKQTDAYKFYSIGMLPPAHIHARARRWAVKMFLSHLHHVMYVDWFEKNPPLPYIINKGEGHRHILQPPNWPMMKTAKNLKEMGD